MKKILKTIAIVVGSLWLIGIAAEPFLDDTETTSTPEPTPVTNTIVEPDKVTEEMIVNKSIRVLNQEFKRLGYKVKEHQISAYNPKNKRSWRLFSYEVNKNGEHYFSCTTQLTKDNKAYLTSFDVTHKPDLSDYTINKNIDNEIIEQKSHLESENTMALYLQEYTD